MLLARRTVDSIAFLYVCARSRLLSFSWHLRWIVRPYTIATFAQAPPFRTPYVQRPFRISDYVQTKRTGIFNNLYYTVHARSGAGTFLWTLLYTCAARYKRLSQSKSNNYWAYTVIWEIFVLRRFSYSSGSTKIKYANLCYTNYIAHEKQTVQKHGRIRLPLPCQFH